MGGQAVFIVHDEPELLRDGMLEGLEIPFPVGLDLERNYYRRWGLNRAPLRKIYLDPRVWMRYARILAGGQRWIAAGRDTLQLGGDFVVDRRGLIAYSRPQDADDRPPVMELLAAMEEAG